MGVDSPDLVIATRLLDQAKHSGFVFQRAAPGEDGPLVGQRIGGSWIDVIHIAGFSHDCLAMQQRTSSLVLPWGGRVERHVEGSALEVLNEVLTWGPPP